jgi:copper resistance protein B
MRRRVFIVVAALANALAAAQGQSEMEHVPPDAPQSHVDHDMSYREMAELMGMDDRAKYGKVMLDRAEWIGTDGSDTFEWDAGAWYGGDFHKGWIEAEGERAGGVTHESRLEAGWERIVSAWWSVRAGARLDGGEGPSRGWAGFGIAGLAPGFIEMEAMVYLGEGGRSALRLTSERDLLITQRLVLQPSVELDVYGEDDPARLVGAGLDSLEVGLRLRYEWRREVAPYIGARWSAHFGDSADLRRAAGEDPRELSWLAGVRAWF